MGKTIKERIDTITTVMPYGYSIALFRKALMVFLLCNTLFLLSYSKILYGAHSYFIPFDASHNFILRALSLLERPQFAAHWQWFVGGQILSIIACLLLPYKRISTLLVYFFTMSLYYKTIPIQNAGFNLLVIVLFLLFFMDENANNTKQPYLRIINITVSNFAVWVARFQVITLYVVATWFKLYGTSWLNGTAMYYVLFTDTFSHPWVRELLIGNSFMIHFLTWFALGFQLLFPILIWFKRTNRIMLVLGILFHVMIMVVMGIIDFGIIMLIMYLLFYTPKKSIGANSPVS
jgi:hypothetical protein